jgi:hypothetical protein
MRSDFKQLTSQTSDPRRRLRDSWLTHVKQRALLTRRFVGGRWNFSFPDKTAQLKRPLLCALPQISGELDFSTPLAAGVEYSAQRDGHTKHFLKTQRLGAELNVVVFPPAPFPKFELDWVETFRVNNLGVWSVLEFRLHDIAFAAKTQPLGPHRQCAQQRYALHYFIARKVRMLMDDIGSEGVLVVLKDAVDMDERGPARAKEVMIQGGERDHFGLIIRNTWRWNHRDHVNLDSDR